MCEPKGAFQIIRDISDEKNWKATLEALFVCAGIHLSDQKIKQQAFH